MEWLLFLGAFVLLPGTILAALAATMTSWLGIRGTRRLLCISVAPAVALGPVFVAGGHGAMPLPFIVALVERTFSSGSNRPLFGDAPDGVLIYSVGVLVFTAFIALVLHLFFRRWAHDRS